MPIAPVAKGVILSLSLLIAAGIAVYDNPQVREWIDESRRRIALALNGPDVHRPRPVRAASSEDASIREDASPEAAERRRQAREEILRRGRVMEERRRKRSSIAREKASSSFDKLVNSDGSLREKDQVIDLEAMAAAITTAADKVPDEGLRKRTKEAVGAAMGSAVANPFADEMGIDAEEDEKMMLEQALRSQPDRERSATIRSDSPLLVDTNASARSTRATDAVSSHSSELLVDLTPTTSVAPSVSGTLLSSSPVLTPTSTNHPNAQNSEQEARQFREPASFQSIQEWASTASTGPASFYSPPESEHRSRDMDTASESNSQATSTTVSVIGTNDIMSEGAEDLDTMSDAGRISTPSSWSEVGSMMSEE